MVLRPAALLLSLLIAAPHVQAADTSLIPVSSFASEDQYYSPRMSPDGKYLAITARVRKGERLIPTIMVYELPGMKQVSASQLQAREVPIGYTWVSNTRLVVAKGREVGSLEAPHSTGEVIAMDADGGKPEYLYGYKMEKKSKWKDMYSDNMGYGYVSSVPRPLSGRFFMTTHTVDSDTTFLYDVNAVNGRRSVLATLKYQNFDFVIQNNGMPRFAMGSHHTEHRDVLYLRDANKDEWVRVDETELYRDLWPFAFSADDSQFMASYTPNGAPSQLVRVDMKTGKRSPVVDDAVGSIVDVEYGPAGSLPFGAASEIGIPRLHYIDPGLPEAQLHQKLSKEFAGQSVRFINYADDGSRVLFVVHSDRDPGAYYLFDRTTNRISPLFIARDGIDPDEMAERRPITFAARDGLQLHGYLTLPKSIAGHKPALVLLPHGGPHGGNDTWHYDNDAQFLASRGYAVLQVNFRGSAGRGRAFQQSGWRQWGGKIQDDLIDGVKWSVAQGLADGERVCAFGASFGAYSALMVAAREPDMFKCAVGYAGVYDLNLLFREGGQQLKNIYTDYVGRDPEELTRFSPASQAAKIKVPVLLVHGKDDEVAPFKHAETMRAALQKEGRDPEWMAVADEGHGFYATKNVEAFYLKLEAFLAKHLK
ncbi:MAG: prolyl oligopeptidase family serine peptidase [Pseudomonadota bacterium]